MLLEISWSSKEGITQTAKKSPGEMWPALNFSPLSDLRREMSKVQLHTIISLNISRTMMVLRGTVDSTRGSTWKDYLERLPQSCCRIASLTIWCHVLLVFHSLLLASTALALPVLQL